MSSVPIYKIDCPNGHTIELPETIIEGIIQHLRGSYSGESVLNFVCSECKTAFYYDYQNAEPSGRTDAPRQISEFHVLSVECGCDGSNCIDNAVLVAIRSRDMSEESVQQETKTWNVSGAKRKSGFHALPFGISKHPPFQFFAGGL
jgi:hypothetical protein